MQINMDQFVAIRASFMAISVTLPLWKYGNPVCLSRHKVIRIKPANTPLSSQVSLTQS